MKAEPRPTKDVNREGGAATANGRWFRRFVRRYRPGFEPDKSAATWVGKRVEARTDSGWGTEPGYTGIVLRVDDREEQGEYGWFRLAPDKTEPMFGYVDKNILATQGVLAHTAEFYPPNDQKLSHRRLTTRRVAGSCGEPRAPTAVGSGDLLGHES